MSQLRGIHEFLQNPSNTHNSQHSSSVTDLINFDGSLAPNDYDPQSSPVASNLSLLLNAMGNYNDDLLQAIEQSLDVEDQAAMNQRQFMDRLLLAPVVPGLDGNLAMAFPLAEDGH